MTDTPAGGNGTPVGMTDDLRDEINKMLGTTVSNMLTARLKSFEKQIHEKLGETVGTALTSKLPEILQQLKPADPDPNDKGGKSGKKAEDVIELATLRKQISDLNLRAEAADRKAAEAVAKTRASTLKQISSEKLADIGIDGVRFKGAFAMLQQEGRIKYRDNETDEIIFVDDTGTELDLNVGLQGWAKGEDAKIFLPPSGAKGSGSRPGRGEAQPPGKPTKAQQWETIGNALRDRLSEL